MFTYLYEKLATQYEPSEYATHTSMGQYRLSIVKFS